PPFTNPHILEDIANRVDNFARLLHNVEELSDAEGGEYSPGLLVVQHRHKDKIDLSSRFVLQKARSAAESLLSSFELTDKESDNKSDKELLQDEPLASQSTAQQSC